MTTNLIGQVAAGGLSTKLFAQSTNQPAGSELRL